MHASCRPSNTHLRLPQFEGYQDWNEYHPNKSEISRETMAVWCNKPLSNDLLEVPGIVEKTVRLLGEGDTHNQITNVSQLMGKVCAWPVDNCQDWQWCVCSSLFACLTPFLFQFLMFKGPDGDGHLVTSTEQEEKFYQWLKHKGINDYRCTIAKAVAEKAATFFQESYDASNFYLGDDFGDDSGDDTE